VAGQFGSPKSKRSSRAVPLADALGRDLELHFRASRYQADDDLVCCNPQLGSPLDRSRVLKRFKAAAHRAGVGPVRFHDPRHTFGTHMAAQGVAMRTLQEWMGHRDFKTTLIYADLRRRRRSGSWSSERLHEARGAVRETAILQTRVTNEWSLHLPSPITGRPLV